MKKTYMNLREKAIVASISLVVTVVVAFLFYHSVWGIVLAPVVYVFVRRRWIIEREKKVLKQLREDFMYGLQVLNGALQAGFSMENAWKEVEKEFYELHREESVFYQEIRRMNGSVTYNVPLEGLFSGIAERYEVEELTNFAQIMEFGRKSGGNWRRIIEETVLRMMERYEAQREIETMIAGKKLEQQVMNLIPLGMLLFLQFSAWDYVSVLYESVFGTLVMTACLALYVIALLWSGYIMEIQV